MTLTSVCFVLNKTSAQGKLNQIRLIIHYTMDQGVRVSIADSAVIHDLKWPDGDKASSKTFFRDRIIQIAYEMDGQSFTTPEISFEFGFSEGGGMAVILPNESRILWPGDRITLQLQCDRVKEVKKLISYDSEGKRLILHTAIERLLVYRNDGSLISTSTHKLGELDISNYGEGVYWVVAEKNGRMNQVCVKIL